MAVLKARRVAEMQPVLLFDGFSLFSAASRWRLGGTSATQKNSVLDRKNGG